MSKRKLSRRQAWRIHKIQGDRVERSLRKEQQIEQQMQGGQLGRSLQGTVVAHFGTQVLVEADPNLPIPATQCHMRTNLGHLVTGDRVVWCPGSDPSANQRAIGVVEAIMPRRNQLVRPSLHRTLRPIAANIDLMVLVIAPEPEIHAELIDRYLVAAEVSRIKPLILLNKTDLLNEHSRVHLVTLLKRYQKLGYNTLQMARGDTDALVVLQAHLKDQVSIFVGQSGVGKSSLINGLMPEDVAKTGVLSSSTGEGRHTTTTARLYHFPSGGDLIDSPGVREFGLWHMEAEQILSGFIELAALRGTCKFRNCRHQSEPACKVREALAAGEIDPQRFRSFLSILRHNAEHQLAFGDTFGDSFKERTE